MAQIAPAADGNKIIVGVCGTGRDSLCDEAVGPVRWHQWGARAVTHGGLGGQPRAAPELLKDAQLVAVCCGV